MAKKTTTAKEKTVKPVALDVENNVEMLESVPEEITIEKVEEALKNVDTEVKIEEPKVDVQNDETIDQINNVLDTLKVSKEEFNKKIEENPDNQEEIIKEELKKAENLKKEVEKIAANVKQNNGLSRRTSTWNGIISW